MVDEEVDDKPGVTPSPLVPIISVTPHSPAGKPYPILEDNLQQLHYIHESVQQMRDLALQPFTYQEASRLSSSCPSLNDAGSDPDLISSINSTPTQTLTVAAPIPPRSLYHKRGSGEWELYRRNAGAEGECEVARRRSWAALEDLSHGKDSCKPGRQRRFCKKRFTQFSPPSSLSGNDLCSISLSSMESDMDDPFCESTANLLGTDDAIARVRQARTNPNSSTHSLNEADLQGDFKIVVSKREAENRLLNTRLNSPLQKSVSTPSIIAVRELANTEPIVVEPSATTLPVHEACRTHELVLRRHSGHQLHGTTESDEDDVLDGVPAKGTTALHFYAPAAYDDHPEKRRKRGSLFFRKKKEKTKKTPHQWVTVCYGNSQVCDLCSKSLTNKPSVYCENCTITAHQNSCKDNLAECKGKINKTNVKNGGLAKPSGKRGSSSNTSGSPSSQVNIDDDHHYHPTHHDNSSYADEVPQAQYEFLDEALVTVNDLETDPFLGLQDEEPDSWTPTVTKEIVKKLKEKEIKRQEHLYEFILTEKHHCLTLRVMQKVFVDGLQRYLNLGASVDRMFPRLCDLAEIHLGFLHKLRTRQKDNPVIENIGDILLEQFGGPASARLKSVYGEFCSNHRNAIDIYKYYMQSDARFAEFVKHCQINPLLKKKGIPECILFVTQRLTKYPLLIEPLIKTLKDNREEQEKLVKALSLIKEILVEVDAQVAEKEKEDRKLEIYNRVEAKSFTTHKGQKFKKSDILDEKRKLRFEGIAMLMQGRGKMQVVLVIVFSDVLCFLLENNHKYSFFTPENKAGVVSLQKLLVREKAGQESRGIYLISSNPAEPEMFELKVHKPKDKQIWIKAIRTAVRECPEDEDEYSSRIISSEERQKRFDIKQRHLKELVELLKQKDKEQALVLEEKIALQLKLLTAAGLENVPERPSYMELVSDTLDSSRVRQDVHLAVKRVNQITKSLYASATNLSRSSSSVGEQQSDTFISPSLPKRAETFGGFDNQSPNARATLVQKKQPSPSNGESPLDSPDLHQQPSNRFQTAVNCSSLKSLFDDDDDCPTLLTEQDHQLAVTHLAHHVYTLSCIISHQMTSIDSLEAEIAVLKSHSGEAIRPLYRHNQQLEELRNLQDKLQSEREVWHRERDAEMKDLQQKKDEIIKLQEQLAVEQADVIHQREQLYRKLEALTNQGVVMRSSLLVSSVPSTVEDITLPPAPATDPPKKRNDPSKRKPPPSVKAATLPLNLISTTNQQRVATYVQFRQQLPLKLATKLGSTGSTPSSPSSSPQQLLPLKLREGACDAKNTSSQQKQTPSSPTQFPSHSRTGSSPALMQNVQLESKPGRTNTYPKLPDKFKMKSPKTGQDSVPMVHSKI